MPNGKQRAARRDRAPRRDTAATAAEPETTAVERLIAHCEEVVQAFAATLEDSTAKGRRDAEILRELAEIRQRLLAPLRLANLRSDVAAECETWPSRDRVAKVSEQAIDALGRLASDDIRVYPMERDADGVAGFRATVDSYVSTREDWLEEKHGFLLPAIDSLRGLARPAGAIEMRSMAPGDAKPAARHSADFTYVRWFGVEYTFALGVQADAVRVLWEEWERTGLGLHQQTIRERIDAERDNFQIPKAFRGHPAFGMMIVSGGDGRYRLNPPAPSV